MTAVLLLLLRERQVLTATSFVEIVVWRPSEAIPGSAQDVKYSLALVADGVCVLRYDNERGKGDHKHLGSRELADRFRGLAALQNDFWSDVEAREAQS